jgi:hypothetical protein
VPTVKRPDDEDFLRRFAVPQEHLTPAQRALNYSGSRRLFISPNVTKLEDYRPTGEFSRIVTLLKQRRREDEAKAIEAILADARRRAGKTA